METVYGAFERTARRHGDRPFLHLPGFSYSESLEKVRELSARYAGRGYGKGHRIALKLGNRPEFLLNFLALNSLGRASSRSTPTTGRPSWTTCSSTAAPAW